MNEKVARLLREQVTKDGVLDERLYKELKKRWTYRQPRVNPPEYRNMSPAEKEFLKSRKAQNGTV